MGGAPMLLMVAAVGVGYGWTPDDRGGVEFVIQIPPDKVEHFRRSGELSSRIPEEIRGSVSRVVLRVGEGPLERTTPESDEETAAGRRVEEADARRLRARDELAAVPVPSIEDSRRGGESAGSRGGGAGGRNGGSSEAVMKPDPQQSGGLSMPADFGDSARGAAQNLRDVASETAGEAIRQTNQQLSDGADRARREAAAAANEMVESGGRRIQDAINRSLGRAGTGQGRAGPASSGGESSAAARGNAVPPFTGSGQANALAGNNSLRGQAAIANTPSAGDGIAGVGRGGGTQLTDTPARVRPNGPSTAPIDRGYGRWYTPDAQAADGQTRNAAPTAKGTTGRRDASAQQPSAAAPGRTSNGLGGAGDGANRFGQLPASLATTANGRGEGNDQLRGADARLRGYAPGAASSSQTSDTPATWSVNAAGEPIDRKGRPVAGGRDQPTPEARLSGVPTDSAGGSLAADRRDAYADPPRGWNVQDRRGATEFEGGRGTAYGNGGRDPREDRYARSGRLPDQVGYPNEDRYAERPTARDRGAPPRRESDRDKEPDPPAAEEANRAQTPPESNRKTSDTGQAGAVRSASDLTDGGNRADSSRAGQAHSLAAQPVFNGLLLFSFVANIYLFFWLKNLRHQFREMVAAKRMAHTGTSGTN